MAGRLRSQTDKLIGQFIEAIAIERVYGASALLLPMDKPGLFEQVEVLGDCRLRQTYAVAKVTTAAALANGKLAQDFHP